MAKVDFHAGDFGKGKGSITFGFTGNALIMVAPWQAGDGFLPKSYTYQKNEIENIVVASEENVKKIGGTVGWGVAGAVLLGPVGLLAGLLAGGRKKEVTFIATFKDGKKLLGTTDSKTFTSLTALTF